MSSNEVRADIPLMLILPRFATRISCLCVCVDGELYEELCFPAFVI
jgi:hypothetical protein